MKKTIKMLLLILMLGTGVNAQTFQGKVDFVFKVTGENAAMAEAMMPTALHITVGKTAVLTEMEGGMMAAMMGKILVDTKKGETWIINDAEETAYLLKEDKDKEEAPEPAVTKEDETITMFGYECQKYKLEAEAGMGMTMTQYIWATDKIIVPKGPEGSSGGPSMLGAVQSKEIKGMPLKTMVSIMGMTMTMSATEVSTTPPSKATFKIPKGYKKSEMDPASLMGGMGGM
jgi:Domain of unknown function (DUF4412)